MLMSTVLLDLSRILMYKMKRLEQVLYWIIFSFANVVPGLPRIEEKLVNVCLNLI